MNDGNWKKQNPASWPRLQVPCVRAVAGDEEKWHAFVELMKTPEEPSAFELPPPLKPVSATDSVVGPCCYVRGSFLCTCCCMCRFYVRFFSTSDSLDDASYTGTAKVVEHEGNLHAEFDKLAAPAKKATLILSAPISTLPKNSFVAVRAPSWAASPFWIGKVRFNVTKDTSTFEVLWYTGASGEGQLNGKWRPAQLTKKKAVRGKRKGRTKTVRKNVLWYGPVDKASVFLHHFRLTEKSDKLPLNIKRAMPSIQESNVSIDENDNLCRRVPRTAKPATDPADSDVDKHNECVSSDDEGSKKRSRKQKAEEGVDEDEDENESEEEDSNEEEEEDAQKKRRRTAASAPAVSPSPLPVADSALPRAEPAAAGSRSSPPALSLPPLAPSEPVALSSAVAPAASAPSPAIPQPAVVSLPAGAVAPPAPSLPAVVMSARGRAASPAAVPKVPPKRKATVAELRKQPSRSL